MTDGGIKTIWVYYFDIMCYYYDLASLPDVVIIIVHKTSKHVLGSTCNL